MCSRWEWPKPKTSKLSRTVPSTVSIDEDYWFEGDGTAWVSTGGATASRVCAELAARSALEALEDPRPSIMMARASGTSFVCQP